MVYFIFKCIGQTRLSSIFVYIWSINVLLVGVTRVGWDTIWLRPKDIVKFNHSRSECLCAKFLLKSPNKINSLPSLETVSMKSSNRSVYLTFESGGRYKFPTKNDFPFSGVISVQMIDWLIYFGITDWQHKTDTIRYKMHIKHITHTLQLVYPIFFF